MLISEMLDRKYAVYAKCTASKRDAIVKPRPLKCGTQNQEFETILHTALLIIRLLMVVLQMEAGLQIWSD